MTLSVLLMIASGLIIVTSICFLVAAIIFLKYVNKCSIVSSTCVRCNYILRQNAAILLKFTVLSAVANFHTSCTCYWYYSNKYEWAGERGLLQCIVCFSIQTSTSLSSTLDQFLDDQTVQESWNHVQENVRT